VIKILYKLKEAGEGIWIENNKSRCLREFIEELVDKDNWTIIAATTEYIILQKEIEEDPQERRERLEKEKIKILSTPI